MVKASGTKGFDDICFCDLAHGCMDERTLRLIEQYRLASSDNSFHSASLTTITTELRP